MNETPPVSSFPASRAAIIAVGIAAFMLMLRPFGLSVDNLPELLVVIGFAPLNFALMLLIHAWGTGNARLAAAMRIGAIATGNFGYVYLLGGSGEIVSTGIKVAVVTLLVVGAVALWLRERRLTREVIELRDLATGPGLTTIVLRGEGEKEVLQLVSEALLCVRASGNYAEVHFLSDGAVKTQLLRATLAGIEEMAPEQVLTRCHRSWLVNLSNAERLVTERGRSTIEFSDGTCIPVSRTFKAQVLSSLKG